jgi:CHAT domain-containing protein/tetratricopeptide (TPR) repeat protein
VDREARWLAGVAAATWALAAAAAAQDLGVLPPGTVRPGRIAGGEVHRYRVPVAVGEFVRVHLQQEGGNVLLALLGPAPERRQDVDNNRDPFGPEYASTIADAPGEVEVRIEPPTATSPRTSYTLVVQQRPAGPADEQLAAADDAFNDATRLRLEETASSRRRGVARYDEARLLYRAAGDQAREVETFNRIGLLHIDLSEPDRALVRLAEGLATAGAADPAWRGHLLNNSGLAHWIRADLGPALDFYQQALETRRTAGDRSGEVSTLYNIGLVHRSRGDYGEAERSFAATLPLRRAFGDRRGEANSLLALGQTQNLLGRTQEALDTLARSLELWRAVKERTGEATALAATGTVYEAAGDLDRAQDLHLQALTLYRGMEDRRRTAASLHKLGDVAGARGDHAAALAFYEDALRMRRQSSDRRGQVYTLASLGRTRLALGDPAAADRGLREALDLARDVGDRVGEADVLEALGEAALRTGRADEAAGLFTQSLERRQAAGDRRGAAEAEYGLARTDLARGALDSARRHIAAALELLESQRAAAASPELRAAFLASVQSYYDLEVEVLLRLHAADPAAGWQAAALDSAERARARGLLEVLVEGRVNLREGVDPALVAQERALRSEIAAQEFARVRLLGAEQPDAARMETVRQAVDRLREGYADLEGRIRAASPRAARLNEVRPPAVREVQDELDPGSALFEYHLGEARSVLWVVGRDEVRSFVLPPRAEIERLAARVHAGLTSRSRQPSRETPEARRARIAQADAEAGAAASELSRVLLAPAAGVFPPERIVVVSDGALRYVPFAALPHPGRSRAPLVETHEITHLPSAATLVALRRGRPTRPVAGGRTLVMADPVFAAEDPRVRVARAGGPVLAEGAGRVDPEMLRAAADAGLSGFPRLRLSRREAEAISALLPAERRRTALDFQASRASLLEGDLSGYRVLHFATHGLLDSRRPELSGLVLSLVDREGRPQDGFLRLNDVFGLRLDAELVVMSACQTALGRHVRGEGVIGLTRGFLHAGASRVVSSLWSVQDLATAELMRRFYRGVLHEGRAPAAALRAAQASMAREARWRAPYYWAAFTLEGEWR